MPNAGLGQLTHYVSKSFGSPEWGARDQDRRDDLRSLGVGVRRCTFKSKAGRSDNFRCSFTTSSSSKWAAAKTVFAQSSYSGCCLNMNGIASAVLQGITFAPRRRRWTNYQTSLFRLPSSSATNFAERADRRSNWPERPRKGSGTARFVSLNRIASRFIINGMCARHHPYPRRRV